MSSQNLERQQGSLDPRNQISRLANFRERGMRDESLSRRWCRPHDDIVRLVLQLVFTRQAEGAKSLQWSSRPLNLGSIRRLSEGNHEAASFAVDCPVVVNGLEKNVGSSHFGCGKAAVTRQLRLRARRCKFWSPVERTAFRAVENFNQGRGPGADVVLLHRLLV